LADLAGITPRALHHYDHIGLLRPTFTGDNGYRYYTPDALLRLQQIMLYRELDFSLAEIQAILDEPQFDLVAALHSQKRTLQQRLTHMNELLHTIDRTLLHLEEGQPVASHDLFAGFDEARQAHYEQEIAEKYGEAGVIESRKRWQGYSAQQKQAIQDEGNAIYRDFVAHIDEEASGLANQKIVARWHDHLRYFYEPTRAIMLGLAEMYVTHPDFVARFSQLHPNLPAALHDAIVAYCHTLQEPEASFTEPSFTEPSFTEVDGLLENLLGDE
jgi:DNA-binding transcriptional MerR regulator